MLHQRPVVSRPVGIAGDYRDHIVQYHSIEELIQILNTHSFPERTNYNLEAFSADAYLNKLHEIHTQHRAR